MDGAEGHELDVFITGRTTQTHATGNANTVGQATRILDPPPAYQSNPHQNEVYHIVASETADPALVGTSPIIRARTKQKWSLGKAICCMTLIISGVMMVTAVSTVVRQAAHSSGERTTNPKVFRRCDLLPSPTIFSAVSGLYMIPATTTKAYWLQADRSRVEPQMSTTITLENTARDSNGIGETPFSTNPKRRREVELIASEEAVTFNRWGVEILYRLRRRAVIAIHIQMGWCINNVCSKGKVLSVMCKKKHKEMDRFQKQECDWCWDEKQGAKGTPMQKDEIAKHCKTVSQHAANFLLIVCGLLLFSVLAILAILIPRLRSRTKARTDLALPTSEPQRDNRSQNFWPFQRVSSIAKPPEHAGSSNQEVLKAPWYRSVFEKPSKSLGTSGGKRHSRTRPQERRGDPYATSGTRPMNEKPHIPIMTPAIGSRTISNLEDMEQRSILDVDPYGQRGVRRSSRRSGAVSSGSEHIPMTEGIAMIQRSFIGEHGLAEAGKDPTLLGL